MIRPIGLVVAIYDDVFILIASDLLDTLYLIVRADRPEEGDGSICLMSSPKRTSFDFSLGLSFICCVKS